MSSNIRYVPDSEVHGWDDYWQTPYQTLRLGTGDCEDMVVLYVSICEALGYDAVLVSQKGHVSAAVLVEPLASDFTVSFDGRTYVTAETTNASSLGSRDAGSHQVYPTRAGLAIYLILLVDALAIGLAVFIMKGAVFRWHSDGRRKNAADRTKPLTEIGNHFPVRFYTIVVS